MMVLRFSNSNQVVICSIILTYHLDFDVIRTPKIVVKLRGNGSAKVLPLRSRFLATRQGMPPPLPTS